MKIVAFGILVTAALAAIAVDCGGQGRGADSEFPACSSVRIPSPDQRWLLVSSSIALNCPATKDAAEVNVPVDLSLLNQRTHHVHKIRLNGWGGSAEWSPDSESFFVNDFEASNIRDAYLFRADPLRRLNLRSVIMQNDRSAQKWMDGHSYVIARKWVSSGTALVQLCGHTDETPAVQFDVRYRVNMDGKVEKISEHHGPPDDADCSLTPAP